jgi:heptosyltransferase-2
LKFNRAYILKRSFSSALLAYLAGIPKRIGFNTEGRGFLLTERIPFDPKIHEVRNFLAHLSLKEEEISSLHLSFWPSEGELDTASRITDKNLEAGRPRILIHALAANQSKMWPLEKWAELMRHLRELRYQLVISGAPQDAPYYEALEKQSGVKADLNLCNTGTSLRENVCIYGFCHAAICVDSGPLHLAAAMNLPVVGIFGASSTERWHPWTNTYQLLAFSSSAAEVAQVTIDFLNQRIR